MRLKTAVAAITSIALTFAPQVVQGEQTRSQVEAKYLAGINRQLDATESYGVLGIDATTSTREKLKYGYQVCQDLDIGKSFEDFTNDAIALASARSKDDTYAADHLLYFLMMRKSAILNVCPKYKPLLNS